MIICRNKIARARRTLARWALATAILVSGPTSGLAHETAKVEDEMTALPAIETSAIKSGLSRETALAECQLAEEILQQEINLDVILMLDNCVGALLDNREKSHYLHLRGEVFGTIGMTDRAVADFTQASTLKPDKAAYKIALGLALLVLKDNEAAMAAIKSALRLDPDNADAMAAMGKAHYQSGSLAPAEAFLGRALEINPAHVPALVDRGRVLMHRGDILRAKGYFDQVLALTPDNAAALLQRGICLYRLGETEAALADLGTAAALDPNNHHIFANRAAILTRTGQDSLAIVDFDTALDINPGAGDALYGRGFLRQRLAGRDKEKMDAAHSDLRMAITVDPENDQLEAAMAILKPEEKSKRRR